MYRGIHAAASCAPVGAVAEIGVNGAVCHIGASNLVPGFLPRTWGSLSYGMGQVEHGGLRGRCSSGSYEMGQMEHDSQRAAEDEATV